MAVTVKICGLTEPDGLAAAVEHGADYIGLVFFAKSPRFIAPEAAAELIDCLPGDIGAVGLFVDPDDAWLDEVLGHVRLDMIQLHGGETPERVDAVRLDFATPVMKALAIAEAADLDRAAAYADHADMLLFDAKPPQDADRPGGNALSFDWGLMKGFKSPLPWLLAGGLTPDNAAEAVRVSGAPGLDVSTGVESAPGIKNPAKIAAFIAAARGERD